MTTSTYSVTRDTYYVYEHIRNDTGQIFYVGKGLGKRAFSKHHRNRHWNFVVDKANGYTVNFLKENINEELALLCEIERINQLRRLNIVLCNYTNGGEGTSGYKHSNESKLKISEFSKKFMTGRKMSPESIKKMVDAKRGTKLTEEHKAKISRSNTGKIMSRDSVEKARLARQGAKRSPEVCAKISAACKAGWERKRNKDVI